MSESLKSPEPAEIALTSYRAKGCLTPPADLPEQEANIWIKTCEQAELSPEQALDYGWLLVEKGVGQFLKTGIKAPALPLLRRAHQQLQQAAEATGATPYTRAKAFLAWGGLPVLRARIGIDHLNDRIRAGLYNQNHGYQARAASEAVQMLQEPLDTTQVRFLQSLGFLLLINSSESPRFVALPGPPRFYESDDPHDLGWGISIWDTTKGQELSLRIAESGPERPDYVTISPDVAGPVNDDAHKLAVAHAVLETMAGAPADQNRAVLLHNTLRTVESNLMQRLGGKPRANTIFHLRRLHLEEPAEQEAPEIKPLDLTNVTSETVIDWYKEQTDGRLLTLDQAKQLEKLLLPLTWTERRKTLSPEDIVTMSRLHIECGLGFANENPQAAEAHYNNAEIALQEVIPILQANEDTVAMYGAALELASIPFYRPITSKQPISQEVLSELCTDLAGILREIVWERNRPGRSAEHVEHMNTMLLPALNALILSSQSNGTFIATPSLPRQRGEHGWHINAWQANDEGTFSVPNMHKLAFVTRSKGGVRMSNGIAQFPLQLVGQARQPDQLLLAVAYKLENEDKKDLRKEELFNRVVPKATKILQAAVETNFN